MPRSAINDGLTRQQRWLLRHGERARAIKRSHVRRWRERNPEQFKESGRRSYARYAVKRREHARSVAVLERRRMRGKTPEGRLLERLRKYKRRKAPGDGLTRQQWLEIVARFNAQLCEVPLFPPAPGDFEGWEYVLERWPELSPALSKSELRRMADGPASRADRLRLGGNGVVPLAAAAAFLALANRF